MFVDLGESSYKVCIVEYTPAKLSVLSTHCDADLGGRDFDKAIGDWAVETFCAKYKNAESPKTRPKSMIKLLNAAEKAKKTLSPAGVKEARINVECLVDEYDFSGTLKIDEFLEMVKPLLARLEGPIQRCLEESKVPLDKIDTVELIGGGTRVACVKETLADILKLDKSLTNNGLSTTMNADEAVARGCALMSAILSPRFKVLPYEVVEQQVHPIKISWEGEVEEDDDEEEGAAKAAGNEVVMFERGSNFPSVRRVTLRKAGPFTVKASYASPMVTDAPTDICEFKIEGPVTDQPQKIRVNVKQDVSGIITLSSAQAMEEVIEEPEAKKEGEEAKEGAAADEAKEEDGKPKKKYKKNNLSFTVSAAMRLPKTEMDKCIEDEARMANADRIAAETAAKRNELESYLYAYRDKIIGELKDFCTEEEASKFSKSLEETEDWLYSDEGFETTKSVYAEKLTGVKALGDPIEHRVVESNTRQSAITSLKGTLETYKAFVNSSDEKYAHISDDEKNVCREACSTAESWLYELIEKQADIPQNVDPVLTVQMIKEKQSEVTGKVTPIMYKPKPIPPKVEEKEGENDEGKKEEGKDDPAPMDTDEKPKTEEGAADTPEPMETEA